MKKRVVALLVLLIFTAGATVGLFADSLVAEVNATLTKAMKIKLDGKEITMKNSDGTAMYPLLYGNRTYVPLRAVSSLLKTPVEYDEKTDTVILGAKDVAVSLLDFDIVSGNDFNTIDLKKTIDKAELNLAGSDGVRTQYNKGIIYTTSSVRETNCAVNISKGYSKLTFVAAASEDSIDLSIVDGDSDIELAIKSIGKYSSDLAQKFEVDVSSVKKLVFRTKANDKKVWILDPELR